jgi:thioredoxin 1
MSNLIQVVGADEFDVATKSGVVMVDFFAPWCGPCRRLVPILEQIAPDFEGRARIIKVDTDKSQDIAVRFGVQSIPMLVILKEGQTVAQFTGVQPAETLKAALEKAMA